MIDRVGFDPAQDERLGEGAEPVRGVVVTVLFDRLGVLLLE